MLQDDYDVLDVDSRFFKKDLASSVYEISSELPTSYVRTIQDDAYNVIHDDVYLAVMENSVHAKVTSFYQVASYEVALVQKIFKHDHN